MKHAARSLVITALLLGTSILAHAQPAFKCKNAAGLVEYSDKPCLGTHEEVPWRPKYSSAPTKQHDAAAEDAKKKQSANSAKQRQGSRKSTYTRWLDSQEEARSKGK